jgi:methionyl-tRNA formyltransferase
MKIAIIGRSEFCLDTAKLLIEKNLKICFFYTSKEEYYHKVKSNDIKYFCKKKKIPFFCDNKINSNFSILKKYKPDLGLSVNWKYKIKKNIIKLFPMGLYNAHLGDLPKYRGNATISWSIINNEKKIALTIHQMNQGIDSGKIYKKKYIKINKNTDANEIVKKISNYIPGLFLNLINDKKKNKINLKPQVGKIIKTFPRQEIDYKINWNMNADEILKIIRSYTIPFEGAYAFFKKEKIRILQAKIFKPNYNYYAIPGQLCEIKNYNPIIACGDKMIEIKKFSNNEKEDNNIKKKIIKSFRNRLT